MVGAAEDPLETEASAGLPPPAGPREDDPHGMTAIHRPGPNICPAPARLRISQILADGSKGLLIRHLKPGSRSLQLFGYGPNVEGHQRAHGADLARKRRGPSRRCALDGG